VNKAAGPRVNVYISRVATKVSFALRAAMFGVEVRASWRGVAAV
jgi:hypothetical protein